MTVSGVTSHQTESKQVRTHQKTVVAVSKYDVLKPWSVVRELIERRLEHEEVNTCITIGLQRVASLHHTHALHCVEHIHCSSTFITQVNTGAANMLYMWKVRGEAEHKEVKMQRLEVHERFEHILFIPKLRVFVAYCSDMSLHIYTDITVGFKLICKTQSPRPLLCLAFNCSLSHLVCGAYGGVLCWDLSEYSWGHMTLLEPLPLPVGPNDCVLHVRVDTSLRRLHFVMDSGGFVWDWERKEVCTQYQNMHSSALAQTAQHTGLDYFITASRDGSIKVFTRTGFRLMYTFTGQYREITGLVIHPREPLLFSSSLDGTIRIWRLDTFEEQERVEIGEEVVGMMLLSQTELACWTHQDIYIYIINLQHGLYNATQSALVTLQYFTFPGLPGRIVAATEDGSIRFLCPMSGEEICIICPLPFHQGISDLALDRPEERLYCLHNGEVLVFEVNSNPCQPEYRVKPHYQQTPVTCLTVIQCSEALENSAAPDELLIFTGHRDGMIRLLKSSYWQMCEAAGGHSERVTILTSSVADFTHTHSQLARKARVLSGGADRCVCVWAVRQNNVSHQITLQLLQKVQCTEHLAALCMLGATLCCSYKGRGQVVILNCGDVFGETQLLFHHGDENHTRPINGLCCLRSLRLFASVGDDGVLKLWSLEGILLREVVFSQPLHKVCFATQRGDVLLGYNNHIYVLPVERYLPPSLLSCLVTHQFEDEVKEEPLPFDHSLPLWFDYASLPVHPQEPQLLSRLGTRAESERNQQTARINTPSLNRVHLWCGLFSSEVDTESPQRTSPQPRYLQPKFPQPKPPQHRSQLKSPVCGSVGGKSETGSMKTPLTAGVEREKSVTYVCPPPAAPRSSSQDTPAQHSNTPAEKKRLPIAPDGYIPNSVIRASFNLKPPENKWRKKKIQLREFQHVSKHSAVGSLTSDSQTVKQWSEGSSRSQKRGRNRKPLTMAEALAASKRLGPLPATPDSKLYHDEYKPQVQPSHTSSVSMVTPSTLFNREFSETSLPSEIFEEFGQDDIPEETEEWRPPSGRLPPSLPATMPVTPSPATPQPLTPEPKTPLPEEPPPATRQDSGRRLLHVHKPHSGSYCLSREVTEVSSASSSRLRSRERLLDVRPLTRGSSLVMDTLPENPNQSSKPTTKQRVTKSTQKTAATSPRYPRPQQAVKAKAKAKPVQEVTKITLDKEVLPKRKVKERPVITSRQNTNLSSTLCDTPLEEEEEAAPVNDTVSLPQTLSTKPHPLLEEIVGQPWFPGPREMTVSAVAQGLSKALGSVSEHQRICDYILKLSSEMEIPPSDLSLLVSSLRSQLQSSSPGHREVAVKTLRALGADTQQVLLEMLPLLLDSDDTVKQEVTAALQQLANVDNKDDLAILLTELGMSTETNMHVHEQDTLQSLKEKISAQTSDDINTTEDALNRIEVWVSSHPTDKTGQKDNRELVKNSDVSKPGQTQASRRSVSPSKAPSQTTGRRGPQPSPPANDLTGHRGSTPVKGHMTQGVKAPQSPRSTPPQTGAAGGSAEHRTDVVYQPVDSRREASPHGQEWGTVQRQFPVPDQNQDTHTVPGSPTGSRVPIRQHAGAPGSPQPSLQHPKASTGPTSLHHTAYPVGSQPSTDKHPSSPKGIAPPSLSTLHPGSQEFGSYPQDLTATQPPSIQLPAAPTGSQRQPVTALHPPYPVDGQQHVQPVGGFQTLPPGGGLPSLQPMSGLHTLAPGGGLHSVQPVSGLITTHPPESSRAHRQLMPIVPGGTEPSVEYNTEAYSGQFTQPHHTLADPEKSWTDESLEPEDPGSQKQWTRRQRGRGNYTYYEWRSQSPRGDAATKAPAKGDSSAQEEEYEKRGEVLPCDMCGNDVQVVRPMPRGTEDYSLHDQTYKYRRSRFGPIREWDETESPEYLSSGGPGSPHLPYPPVSGSSPHPQLGSLRIKSDSQPSTRKTGGRAYEEDSGQGTEYPEEVSTQLSTQLSSQIADADSGVLTDDTQPLKSRVHSLRSKGQPTLSPVRSHTSPGEWTLSPPPENWREFFSRPEAQTRRHIDALKRQTSMPPSLPPISYVREDISIPGDPGIRLLQAVHVQNKEATFLAEPSVQKKHRVDPLPGKLAVKSKQDTGFSKFGILNMSWTSGAQKKRLEQTMSADPTLVESCRNSLVSSHTVLPSIHKGPPDFQSHPPGYQWATPLPPPPDSLAESADPQIRKRHQIYTDYYKLLKQRFSQYISPVQHQHSLLKLCRQRSKLHSHLSQKSLHRNRESQETSQIKENPDISTKC